MREIGVHIVKGVGMGIRARCAFIIIPLLLSACLLCGCETCKGAATGVGVTAVGTAQGAAKDTDNFWQAMLKADDWVRKNLW